MELIIFCGTSLRVDNIQDQGGAERRGLKTYAIICDEKAHNAHAGTFTSGLRTRDLNTEIADPDGIVSISNNQFTLSAGDYLMRRLLRLLTVIDTNYAFTTQQHAVVQYGTNCHQDDTDTMQTNCCGRKSYYYWRHCF